MSYTKLKFIPMLALAFSASLAHSPARADSDDKKAAPAQMQGGLLPGETREQKRERLLAGIEKQVGTLTPDQKAHILTVLKAAGDEMAAARANKMLTSAQQDAVVSQVHGEVLNRYLVALTPEQQLKLKTISGNVSRNRGFGLQTGESFQQRRERLLKNFEEVLPDLTIKQKTELMAINEMANDEIGAIHSINVLTDGQKKEAILKTQNNLAKKVDAVLTEPQRVLWRKHRSERRAETEKQEKTTVAKNER